MTHEKPTEIDDTPKTFRQRHGKKFLALLGILLMVAFLLPTQITEMVGQAGMGSTVLGRLDGRKVRGEDVRDAMMRFQALRSIELQTVDRLGRPVRYPLAAQVMGEAFFAIQNDPVASWLLLREAYAQSPGTTEQLISQWFSGGDGQVVIGVRLGDGRLVAYENLSQLDASRARQAMRDLLTIKSALDVRTSAIRPSLPMVDWLLAQEHQRIRADVVVLNSLDFVSGLPAPETARLQSHFEQFAAMEAGQPDLRDNPFGFGYRIPDRIKLEVLTFRWSELRERVAASKTPEQWTDAAAAYYVQNEADFRSDAPPTGSPLDVSTPATGTIRPFEQVRESIIGRLVDAETTSRLEQMMRRIRNRTEADRQSLTAARATDASASPATAFGPVFDTFDYLERLADDAQRQFGVRPGVASFANRFLSRAEVSAIPEIGVASVEQEGRIIDIPFDLYAFESSRALATPQRARELGEFGLETLQMSLPLVSRMTNDRFLFRIVAVEASHPAKDLESVRDRVTADLAAVDAMSAARARAEAMLKEVRESQSLLSTGMPVVPNVEFSIQSTTFAQLGISEPAAVGQLVNNASKALLASSVDDGFAVVEVPAARKVLLARRIEVAPTWTASAELDQFRLLAMSRLSQQLAQNQIAGDSFLQIDSIYERNRFVPETRPTDSESAAALP